MEPNILEIRKNFQAVNSEREHLVQTNQQQAAALQRLTEQMKLLIQKCNEDKDIKEQLEDEAQRLEI